MPVFFFPTFQSFIFSCSPTSIQAGRSPAGCVNLKPQLAPRRAGEESRHDVIGLPDCLGLLQDSIALAQVVQSAEELNIFNIARGTAARPGDDMVEVQIHSRGTGRTFTAVPFPHRELN